MTISKYGTVISIFGNVSITVDKNGFNVCGMRKRVTLQTLDESQQQRLAGHVSNTLKRLNLHVH